MSQLIFCQSIYPKKGIVEGDTVILLEPFQIKKINKIIVDRDFLKKENRLLNESIIYRDSLLFLKDLQIGNCNESLEKINLLVSNQEDIIKEKNKQIVKKSVIFGSSCLVVGILVGLIIN